MFYVLDEHNNLLFHSAIESRAKEVASAIWMQNPKAPTPTITTKNPYKPFYNVFAYNDPVESFELDIVAYKGA